MTEAGFTQEELALLGLAWLTAGDDSEHEPPEENPLPAGYRERLAIGDLSW